MADRTRLTFDITAELNARLEKIAADLGTSKAEVIKRSLALMDYANTQQNLGKRIGVTDDGKTIQSEIVIY